MVTVRSLGNRYRWVLPVCLAFTQPGYGKELSEVDFLSSGTMVLTASRLAQSAMDAPNAVTVVDRATIEASGYHNLSDLFRLVPGMYVGQANGWFHNVSHTLADEYARRMQVLVDGRSVYLPSIGGVSWDALPLAIDDIERIEVVRGPNAATFGANSFTGVINIITRHPEDVVGQMLHLVVGEHDHREGWFRWAAQGETSSHRVTLGHREDGGFPDLYDDERSNIFNYRGTFDLAGSRNLDIQLGYVGGNRGDGAGGDVTNQPHDLDIASYFVQGDYRIWASPSSEFLAKAYFSRSKNEASVPTLLLAPLYTYYQLDLSSDRWHGEVQYNTDHGNGLRSSVGGFLRRDSVTSLHYFNQPNALDVDSKGVFGHVEWRMAPAWLLNAGAFWEDYELVGGRLSPRLTLSWQPTQRHSVRFGLSRAYRNPVLFETNADWRLRLLDGDGNLLSVFNPFVLASGTVSPERIISEEIGYLGQWPELGLNLDLRVFKERISDFISLECPTGNSADCNPSKNPFTYLPRDVWNIGAATQVGLEGQLKWRPTGRTQILANYAFLRIDSNFDETRYSPHHLAGLHIMHQFPGEIDLTLSQYWVSAFEPIGQNSLPASTRCDARLAKGFPLGSAHAQMAIGVENLGDSYHEFSRSPQNLFDTRWYVHFKVDF